MKDLRAIATPILSNQICLSLEQLSATLVSVPLMLLGIVCFAILSGCTPTLNSDTVAAQIQDELEREDELLLKAVICPERVAIAPETSFTCTGELDPQGTFPIEVTQTDDQGSIEWEVPNSKGLLNLATIEATIQEAIATESDGRKPLLDCGGTYRINQPGDTFECKVANVTPVKAGQAETLLLNIVVKLDPQGNVTWQQVRRQQTLASAVMPAPGGSPASTNSANGSNAASPNPSEPPPQSATTGAPAVGQTADDFLNNPGATDDF